MGGKNPNLVFADCDYETMLETTLRSSFANQGQICLCGSRVLVQRPIYDEFRRQMLERVRSLRVGDPTDARSDLGALVSAEHLGKIERYVNLAVDEGGDVLTGGHRVTPGGRCANGWFFEPTVVEGLDNRCTTNQEEIFGPVTTLMPFDSEDEALAMANDSRYGLACAIFTTDLSRAHRVARAVDAGIVWINTWMLRDLRTPFGGMKASGHGREGGWEAMRFFTETKNVCVEYGA